MKIYYCQKLVDFFKKSFQESLNLYLNKVVKNDLSDLHKLFDKRSINDFRMYAFNNLNQTNYTEIIHKYFFSEISSILGPEILIQNKVNLSIQMPDDESSILPIHSDTWAGDSFYQINLWLPITDSFETNSMFLFDYLKTKEATVELYKNLNSKYDILNKYVSNEDFVKTKYGEFILFNPAMLHGNVLNKTNKTRISLNLRFKSLNAPGSSLGIRSRDDLAYFKIFNISKFYQECTNLQELNL